MSSNNPNVIFPNYKESSLNASNPRLEWCNNHDGTYRPKNGRGESKPIPEHPRLREMYNFVFTTARDEYMSTKGNFPDIMQAVTEKFGEVDDAITDYLFSCPYDAGSRAGLLIEEPDHYL